VFPLVGRRRNREEIPFAERQKRGGKRTNNRKGKSALRRVRRVQNPRKKDLLSKERRKKGSSISYRS